MLQSSQESGQTLSVTHPGPAVTPPGSCSPSRGLACASGEGADSLGPVHPTLFLLSSRAWPPLHRAAGLGKGLRRAPELAAAPAQPPGAGYKHSQLGIQAAQPGEDIGPSGNVCFPDLGYSPATREIKGTSLHLVGFEAQFSWSDFPFSDCGLLAYVS